MKRATRAAPKRAAPESKTATKKAKPASKKKPTTVTPSVTIAGGKCGEALAFYGKAFGAVEKRRMQVEAGKILHAEMVIGESTLYLNDEFSPSGPPPTGISLHIHVDNADAVWEKAVAAGCKVEMPLADAFWGDRFGQLRDPYGHSWSIAHTNDELVSRGKKWMADFAQDKKEDAKAAKKTSPSKVASPTKSASPKAKSSRKK